MFYLSAKFVYPSLNPKNVMEPKRPLYERKSSIDSLEYLKFALTNCRIARLKDDYVAKERSKAKKVKAVNAKGSSFYHSVSNSNNWNANKTETRNLEEEYFYLSTIPISKAQD